MFHYTIVSGAMLLGCGCNVKGRRIGRQMADWWQTVWDFGRTRQESERFNTI